MVVLWSVFDGMLTDHGLLLIRHGQSQWNALRRWQGLADSPLTDLGRRQTEAAATVLASFEPFATIHASDLGRALQTAHRIAARLGIATVEPDPRWREADAGPWEGLERDAIDTGWPGYLDSGQRPDGFEPNAAVIGRALEACTELLARGERQLVITHSGIIRGLRRHLDGVDERVTNLGGCWVLPGDPGRSEATSIRLGPLLELVDEHAPGR